MKYLRGQFGQKWSNFIRFGVEANVGPLASANVTGANPETWILEAAFGSVGPAAVHLCSDQAAHLHVGEEPSSC